MTSSKSPYGGTDAPGWSSSSHPPTRRRRVRVDDRDDMRWVTYLALGGLTVALGLAIIGGVPFDTPMPTHSLRFVEPTCGLTRGSTAIARGNLELAWRYNPASFLVIGFGAFGILRLFVGRWTGLWLNVRIRPFGVGWIVLGGALIALWAHQQQNAEFIMNSRL